MPCTLSKEEMDCEERRANKAKLGEYITDAKAAAEAACQACRALEKASIMKGQSAFLKAWWKQHKEIDRRAGRK